MAARRSADTPSCTKITALAPTSRAPAATDWPWLPSVAQAKVMPAAAVAMAEAPALVARTFASAVPGSSEPPAARGSSSGVIGRPSFLAACAITRRTTA